MQQGKKVLLRTEVATTKIGSQPKTEVVTQNAVERKEERGRDMELWSRHQFLKTTEPTRSRLQLMSRPLIKAAARNQVTTKSYQVVTKRVQMREIQVATSI